MKKAKYQHDQLNDVLGYVTNCERPGDMVLRLISYRHLRATE